MLPIWLLLLNFKMLAGGPQKYWDCKGTPMLFLKSLLLSVHHLFSSTGRWVFAPNCIPDSGLWAGLQPEAQDPSHASCCHISILPGSFSLLGCTQTSRLQERAHKWAGPALILRYSYSLMHCCYCLPCSQMGFSGRLEEAKPELCLPQT